MQKSTETLRFHFLVYMVTLSITYRYVYGRNMNSDFFLDGINRAIIKTDLTKKIYHTLIGRISICLPGLPSNFAGESEIC